MKTRLKQFIRQNLTMACLASAYLIISACQAPIIPDAPKADLSVAVNVFEKLSSDEFEGRLAGTDTHEKARDFIFDTAVASKMFDRVQIFEFPAFEKNSVGKTERQFSGFNIYGFIETDPKNEKPLLVITAHYDHLGVIDGEIYNGADDNASGSAALFAIAESFQQALSDHDILLAWLDVEEFGLQGAHALVRDDETIGQRPIFNLNLDMISQNPNEIYVSGSYHTPKVRSLLRKSAVNTEIRVKFGHDRPSDGAQDWTLLSDHGAFHQVGIPFAYFGVEDHKHYHQPTDDFETIPMNFYEGSVQTVINAAHILDEHLASIARAAK